LPFHARGSLAHNVRLSLDHVEPGNNSELRPACFSCNAIRGHKQVPDALVLKRMRKWYAKFYDRRLSWWLNSTPGQGGRTARNAWNAKRDERYGVVEPERDAQEPVKDFDGSPSIPPPPQTVCD
jgi:hypothetical protein